MFSLYYIYVCNKILRDKHSTLAKKRLEKFNKGQNKNNEAKIKSVKITIMKNEERYELF